MKDLDIPLYRISDYNIRTPSFRYQDGLITFSYDNEDIDLNEISVEEYVQFTFMINDHRVHSIVHRFNKSQVSKRLIVETSRSLLKSYFFNLHRNSTNTAIDDISKILVENVLLSKSRKCLLFISYDMPFLRKETYLDPDF